MADRLDWAADEDARLIVLRRTLTALESRQRQQERLHAWQLSVADEAARVHFQLLPGELRALELHERVRTAIEQAAAHAALVQELSTARAQLSDALDRAEHAEAEAVCTHCCARAACGCQQALDNARAKLSGAHAELPPRQEALDAHERQARRLEAQLLRAEHERLDSI